MYTLLDLRSVARMVFLPMAANADRTFSRLLEFKCQLLAKGIPEPDAAIVWQSLHDSRDAEANFQSIAGFLTARHRSNGSCSRLSKRLMPAVPQDDQEVAGLLHVARTEVAGKFPAPPGRSRAGT